METKELICIECPRGCVLQVTLNGKTVENVSGNFCIKGKIYAENELTKPLRVVTSTIRLNSGEMLPVKTSKAVQKSLVFDVMKNINGVKAEKPVKIGQILKKNIDGEGTDLISAKEIL